MTETAGRPPQIDERMAAIDPIVAICRPACERLLLSIPDDPINFPECSFGADASGKPGAVQSALSLCFAQRAPS